MHKKPNWCGLEVLLLFARCKQRTSLCQSAVTSLRQRKWCATSASIWCWADNETSCQPCYERLFLSVLPTSSDQTCRRSWRHKKASVRLDYCNAALAGLPQTTLRPDYMRDLFNVRWMQPLVLLPCWDPVTTSHQQWRNCIGFLSTSASHTSCV